MAAPAVRGIRSGFKRSWGRGPKAIRKRPRPAANPHSYELHATALHLLGLDHERLTYYHNGLEQRLTGFEGEGVIAELIG